MVNTFVFDTNAIISAFILANSKTRLAYDKAIDSGILVYSAATIEEIAEVFVLSKFEKYLPLDQRLAAISEFHSKAFFIDVRIALNCCRDPKDNKFLELAIAANASCIITGDDDLLSLYPFRSIPIVNAADFLDIFKPI